MNSDVWVWYIWPAIIAFVCGGGGMLWAWYSSRRLKPRH
jgi:hypothetical protein